jgi:hypothetical protein
VEATALSIAVRTSWDKSRVCRRERCIRGVRVECVVEGRRAEMAPRNAWVGFRIV